MQLSSSEFRFARGFANFSLLLDAVIAAVNAAGVYHIGTNPYQTGDDQFEVWKSNYLYGRYLSVRKAGSGTPVDCWLGLHFHGNEVSAIFWFYNQKRSWIQHPLDPIQEQNIQAYTPRVYGEPVTKTYDVNDIWVVLEDAHLSQISAGLALPHSVLPHLQGFVDEVIQQL